MRKGSHMPEESKRKISIRMIEVRKTINPMKGRFGDKHQNFGKHWDEETRQRMSEGHKGQESPFKGKTHTEESKRKNSEAHKGRVPWNKGLKTGPHTKEHNLHISEGITNHPVGQGQWYTRKNGQTIWLRSSYEARVANVLDNLNIEWSYETKRFELDNCFYIPDFIINNKVIWEVKGWMSNVSRDKLIKFSNLYPEENLRVLFLNDIKNLELILKNNTKFDESCLGTTIDKACYNDEYTYQII